MGLEVCSYGQLAQLLNISDQFNHSANLTSWPLAIWAVSTFKSKMHMVSLRNVIILYVSSRSFSLREIHLPCVVRETKVTHHEAGYAEI